MRRPNRDQEIKSDAARGTSAAARVATKEATPLTVTEQQVLRQALEDLDDPMLWHRVPQSLDQLSDELEHIQHRE